MKKETIRAYLTEAAEWQSSTTERQRCVIPYGQAQRERVNIIANRMFKDMEGVLLDPNPLINALPWDTGTEKAGKEYYE